MGKVAKENPESHQIQTATFNYALEGKELKSLETREEWLLKPHTHTHKSWIRNQVDICKNEWKRNNYEKLKNTTVYFILLLMVSFSRHLLDHFTKLLN